MIRLLPAASSAAIIQSRWKDVDQGNSLLLPWPRHALASWLHTLLDQVCAKHQAELDGSKFWPHSVVGF